MKGPYERLKYDLRRTWECPICKRRERTAPTVTFRHCSCRMKQVDGQPAVMKLVEDGISGTMARKASDRKENAEVAISASAREGNETQREGMKECLPNDT